MMPTDFSKLIEILSSGQVEFIVVGGIAAGALGIPRVTLDLDVVYRRSDVNLARLATALAPISPYPPWRTSRLAVHLGRADRGR
jgi:hypothetical protein